MKKIYPNYSEPKLRNIFLFELNSFIGRKIFKQKSKIEPLQPLFIDLGVGANYTDGWVHVDFYKNKIRRFWKKERVLEELRLKLISGIH